MKMIKNKSLITIVFLAFLSSCSEVIHDHKETYTCPMHRQIRMDHPGECPICGMNLVKEEIPLRPKDESNSLNPEHTEGLEISSQKQQILNLETILVKRGVITKSISLSGQVAFDPEIFSTVSEYKSIGVDSEWGADLKKGVKLKLTKLGLSDRQIQYVISKNEKLFLTGRTGNKALLIFQAYENDIEQLKVGKWIDITNITDSKPALKAKIIAIGNLINQETRTLSIWTEADDPNFVFKPQMYIQGNFGITTQNVLRIPKEAVLPTGKSNLVYKKYENQQFSPSKVQLGFQSEEWAEVLSGLQEGDEIVSKANFLLDSETKLKLGDIRNDKHNH